MSLSISEICRERLLFPDRLYCRSEILSRPSPVPNLPGIYAWYFKNLLDDTMRQTCHTWEGLPLLYIGIASEERSQSLRKRLRYHLKGNAEGSTLRLSLGCLLSDQLGIQLRRIGSGTRMTFTPPGEMKLNQWLDDNAFIAWTRTPSTRLLESGFIYNNSLPLNLSQNENHPFYGTLSQLRQQAKQTARSLPVFTD
jgi:hypothetical protein